MDEHDRQPSRWRVALFGTLRLECDERGVYLPGAKAQALLAFLLLHSHVVHTRDYLADLLWPDAPPDRVRRNLSDALYRIRQALGSGWLATEGEHIALCPDPLRWVDIAAFEAAVQSTDIAMLEAAAAYYTGELLPDLDEDWLLARRVALHEQYLACLLRLGEIAERDNQLESAFRAYQRLTAADPLHEVGQSGLMRVYARMGRTAAALQQYAQFEQLLREELRATPLPETRALAEAIRVEQPPIPTEAPFPFVGRRRERTLLLDQVERLQRGHGGVALIEGPAGVGKTRLLEHVADSAAWRGVTVAWGRAYELQVMPPYSPLAAALRDALVGARAEHVRARLAPPLRAALAGLVPRLAESAMQFSVQPDVPAALMETLVALGATGSHLIILDDVQWADPALWQVLARAERLERVPLLLVLVYRSNELRANTTAWAALQTLDRDLAPLALRLKGLTSDECGALARDLGHTLGHADAAALHDATDGNPFYVQEVLAAGNRRSLDGLLERRLAALSVEARPRSSWLRC